MGKAIVAVVFTAIVGILSLVIGHEYLGGFPEFGSIIAISIMGGFIIYFNERKNN